VEKYNLQIKPSAVKELEAVSHKKDRQKIVERIKALANDPRPPGCQKLSGQERYRIRQGWYRIVYEIDDQQIIIFVVKIGHRKDVYR
jgi:mRNA interferase RelE/StbE